MNRESMSDELIELEVRLQWLAAGEPSSSMRHRMMHVMAEELASSSQLRDQGHNRFWLWPAIAAAVMIVMNLSFTSASRDEFALRPAKGTNDLSAEISALRTIAAQEEGLFK